MHASLLCTDSLLAFPPPHTRMQECAAHGIQYKQYNSFWTITTRFVEAARQLGA